MIIKRIDGKISTSPCKPGPIRAEHDGDFHQASAATQGSSSDEQTATQKANPLNLFQAIQVSRTEAYGSALRGNGSTQHDS